MSNVEKYDAIIVGAGAAGLIVAALLAETGKQILILERGRKLTFDQVPRDHLRNHRYALYGHNTGPALDGHPRVRLSANGRPLQLAPHENGYHNNAMTVGGGTRVYGAMAWRFLPNDFRMASLYGVPQDSSMTDWPISYDDLEPFYDEAEWQIGCCGLAGENKFEGPRKRGYPMPPLRENPARRVMRGAAEKLGWSAFQPPFLINTQTYHRRAACPGCGHCVGFACPVDAKNGTHNTMLPRALATGRCTLVTEAFVERILTDARGVATGVSYFVDDNSPTSTQAIAKVIVVSAGAIESARLLLASASAREPHGLGNNHDIVGRNLQGHYYPGAQARFADPILDHIGPGVSVATCQFNHGNPNIIGGGMLANDFLRLPIVFNRTGLPPDTPRWGMANKRAMRELYSRSLTITGPVHEIPTPDARVTLDPNVRDKFGRRVIRLSGQVHLETIRTAHFMRDRAAEWLRAAGALEVWQNPITRYLSGGQHQAGTCRMGVDPKNSVTDSFGRVHGHENLFICDGSLHPTNGGFNPVLTIMALAFRNARHIALSL
jgi:choline dehydrogenase-like flavoprotein